MDNDNKTRLTGLLMRKIRDMACNIESGLTAGTDDDVAMFITIGARHGLDAIALREALKEIR